VYVYVNARARVYRARPYSFLFLYYIKILYLYYKAYIIKPIYYKVPYLITMIGFVSLMCHVNAAVICKYQKI